MTKTNAIKYLVPVIFLVVALSVTISCGGGGGGGGSSDGTGIVRTTITDPPLCQAPAGPFKKVWVTITRVRAHISDDASPDGGGWVDLADLRSDLLDFRVDFSAICHTGSHLGRRIVARIIIVLAQL